MAWRDPWETVDRANALRAQTDAQTIGMLGNLQGMQVNALQRQNLERQMADERAVREAYTQGAGDPTKTRDLLTRGGFYKQVQDMEKAALDKRKTEAGIGKDEADAAIKRATAERDAIAGIADQAGWDTFRQSLGERGARLPAQFSPEVKLSLVTRADDYVKRMTPNYQVTGGTVTDLNSFTNPTVGSTRVTQAAKPVDLSSDLLVPGPNGQLVPNQQLIGIKQGLARAGAPSVNVKTELKTGESLAGQVGPIMKDSLGDAEAAVQTKVFANQILRAIDSGKAITGTAANARLTIEQLADTVGLGGKDTAEKLANTRSAMMGLANLTLQGRKQMRGQGAVTESESKLAERAASGDINFTPAEIRTLANAAKRSADFQFSEHRRKVKVMEGNPNLQGLTPFYMGPEMPADDYTTPALPTTPAPIAAPPKGYKPL